MTGPLFRVDAKELPSLPNRFDPSGRFLAVLDEQQGCLLFSVAAQAYVGTVAAEVCSDWSLSRCTSLPGGVDGGEEEHADTTSCRYTPQGDRSLRSADGKKNASWSGSRLVISQADGAKTELKIKAGCGADDCPDVVAASFSPDGKQLALARKFGTHIYLVDTENGKTLRTLKLHAAEVVLPDLIAWGPSGLAAVIGLRAGAPMPAPAPAENKPASNVENSDDGTGDEAPADEDADASADAGPPKPAPAAATKPVLSDKIAGAQLVQFRGPKALRKSLAFGNEYDGVTTDGTLAFDPLGRYLFELRTVQQAGTFFVVFDLAEDRQSPLSWHHDNEGSCSQSELSDGRWLPGRWPVWETTVAQELDCTPKYGAWQIYTAPEKRGIAFIKFKKKSDAEAVRGVKDDGKTTVTLRGAAASAAVLQRTTGKNDADNRWEATGKNSLRRLSDREELHFEDVHCVHTAAGVFDCPPAGFAKSVFLSDKDPQKAQIFRGAEVAPLFYHPHLAEDFFDGKPVAPKTPSHPNP